MNLAGLLAAVQSRPAFAALVRRLARSRQDGPAGLSTLEAAKPYLLAALQTTLRRPLLVVVAQGARARELAEQCQIYSASPESVALLPEHDSLFYERSFADAPLVQQRLAALSLLGDVATTPEAPDLPPIVVASVRALMHRVLPPDEFRAARRTLRVGEVARPEELTAAGARLGYEPVALVDEPGTFSRRGGIVDVYPIGWPSPVRIEFFGDEVESLRLFDSTTQRSQAAVSAVQVLPAHEMLPSFGVSEDLFGLDFESLRPEAKARFSRDLERLKGGESFEGLEFYAPYLPSASVIDHLPADGLVVLDEARSLRAAAEGLAQQAEELRAQLVERRELPTEFAAPYEDWPSLEASLAGRVGLHLSWQEESSSDLAPLAESFHSPNPYGGKLKAALDDARAATQAAETVVLVSRQARRIEELLPERALFAATVEDVREAPPAGSLVLVRGSLAEGFTLVEPDGRESFRLLADREIFGWSKVSRAVRPRAASRQTFLADLDVGGYVVHVEHGVARYLGLVRMAADGVERDYLALEYAQGDRLYVPVDQADRVGRYVGPGEAQPALSRLGTQDWVRTKQRVRQAVQQMAEELLELYAARALKQGHAFKSDTPWQAELEASFPYVETPDQLSALNEIKGDMELPRPMDRLLCGDVGYGKTEIALRAAFKAVMDGKQVAVLVPTTVLAQQHFGTFGERLQPFPARVEMLSRFRSEREQRAVLDGLKTGAVDVVIGTHRLIQKDVEFKDLGLVIVDEEQRFGVGHKERLKQLRREVDVLTLSATPIPRTLHMALVGVRDMSTIETPPEDRLPIKTYVAEHDEALIREAILRELDRGGQVYFVHNRVQTIQQTAARLAQLVPEASIAVGHGQMPEDALEHVMVDFSNGKYDVLVCSTIIESGLDIPNVNTIVVNRADMFGLAQLYQLRGRVGRGSNRAYAYFLYPHGRQLSEVAEKRLRTIFEATELGSGFRIAMKDLEIRGAGNLLGPEQHGHVAAVGFHLYTQLLAEAVKRQRGEEVAEPIAVSLDLPLPAHLPESYVQDTNARLSLYQRLAGVTDLDALGALTLEIRDRFGPPPEAALNLLYLVQLKVLAAKAGVESIAAEEDLIAIRLVQGQAFDRPLLSRRFGDQVHVGQTRLAIPRKPRGASWQDLLQQVVEAMGESAPRPRVRAERAPLVPVAPPRKARAKAGASAASANDDGKGDGKGDGQGDGQGDGRGDGNVDGAAAKAKPGRPAARSGRPKAGPKSGAAKPKRPKPDLGVTRVIERGGRRGRT